MVGVGRRHERRPLLTARRDMRRLPVLGRSGAGLARNRLLFARPAIMTHHNVMWNKDTGLEH